MRVKVLRRRVLDGHCHAIEGGGQAFQASFAGWRLQIARACKPIGSFGRVVDVALRLKGLAEGFTAIYAAAGDGLCRLPKRCSRTSTHSALAVAR